MPERRKEDEPLYRRPKTAKESMKEHFGPLWTYGSVIASAPVGGTIAGLKIASKIKKVYDTLAEKKPPRKPTMADKSSHFGGSAFITSLPIPKLPMPSPSKAPSRPAPAAPAPAPAPAPARQPTQKARTQRRRQYRGY